MKKRSLGNSGLQIAPLVFGGNVFGWTVNEGNSFALLDAFLNAGFNCIDTADIYSKWIPGNNGGESEAIIGSWMKTRGTREQVIIATKLGGEMGPGKKGLSKKYIFQAVESSLNRLQTDYIDLYQSHYDDPETPIEETLEAYAELIKQGKVRAIGASNFDLPRLEKSLQISHDLRIPRYESLQPLYNLYDRAGYESTFEPLVQKTGIGVIPYFSLASGFLTGKYRSEADLSKSPRGEGNRKYLNERGFKILAALDEVAAQYNATPTQISLAWIIARPSITAPIASATDLDQLNDLIKAAQLDLGDEAIEKLNQASA
jgi:aryl-alcohol dehydrogenase-like predicted oxidoreductase